MHGIRIQSIVVAQCGIDISNEINANSRTKFGSNEKFPLDKFLQLLDVAQTHTYHLAMPCKLPMKFRLVDFINE